MKLLQVLDAAIAGVDLTVEAGVFLLSQTEPEAIESIRMAADTLRQSLCGETVTYVVNRNLNFTNICEQHCHFCAFRRDAGDPDSFWLDQAQLQEKAAAAWAEGATELCIQGGLNPQAKRNGRSLDYYLDLVAALKDAFPGLHLHAFSPQEIEFIAREDQLSFRDVIIALKDAGVGSLPGTAAEVLDDQIRRQICPEKLKAATWLEIVSTAHHLGLPTTSTMLCGHIETPLHQVQHLDQIRQLQQQAIAEGKPAKITEFILLPFVGQLAPQVLRKKVGRDQPDLRKTLLLTAVARLFLGKWIINHQPSWVKLGLGGATTALRWGCNDLGGTLMEEHITTMAGAQGGTCLTVSQLRMAIASVDRLPAERTTLYQDRHSRRGSSADMI
ncbi:MULTISPECIES: 7,8-didemethyl-8-hydroxy-5-deazariboflavin synthase subunit CofH [Cyanophyceae]|uniref:7,8-didemethyl-8-hydroxy-5-deazariboflavin synthase subunit CofH n=1 Tax=Cyanophyceae TaxID=3028117 RepID=UPI00016DCA20|nr:MULTISPECIES: 7,8-didemethyl-8-hydroxy-5-deazariboflavin synthase subunit CofH [Cyanophyceae]ACA99907.1 radical SAM domain protein [Picosynechococcus sp. PCC 7002]SMH54883.1 FO synthase subunit 2 [Picosynechococcus sp. OG1]SMQ83073.1 FO synthase subunit 2 [Synechococcus sp. 7002]